MKTDSQLQQDVIAELKWEPSINTAGIGVEVNDGVVTLAGHVETFAEKLSAEKTAQRVPGVKALAIEMDVRIPGPSARSDADIAHAAENVLEWVSVLPNDTIKVMVENGWITLSGEVSWHYQRLAATSAVRYLMGVTGVVDNITLGPKVSLSTIQTDIENALTRHALNEAQRISVKVQGSSVTLSGVVSTWAEHDLACQCAWNAPGVRNVIGDITVTN